MWQIETLYFPDWLHCLVWSPYICNSETETQSYNCELKRGHECRLLLIKCNVHITAVLLPPISTVQFSVFFADLCAIVCL